MAVRAGFSSEPGLLVEVTLCFSGQGSAVGDVFVEIVQDVSVQRPLQGLPLLTSDV